MSHKIEQIYDYATAQISAGAVVIDLSLFTSEFFWLSLNHNQKSFIQYLSNFLYSLSKLVQNTMNSDLIFFEYLLRLSPEGKFELTLFLLFRQIFQQVIDREIVKGNTLRLDPNCTDIDREVVNEIVVNICKVLDLQSADFHLAVIGQCTSEKIEYYQLLRVIFENSSLLGDQSAIRCIEGIVYFRDLTIKKAEEESKIMVDKPQEQLQKLSSTTSRLNVSHQGDLSRIHRELSPPRSLTTRKEEYSEMPHDKSWEGQFGKKEARVELLKEPRSVTSHQKARLAAMEGVPSQIIELIESYINAEPNLNIERRIREKLAGLVCKFVEMLVQEEDPDDFQATLTKIDQVVIRKTQNLLTCLFRQNKTEFKEILRLKQDQSEDNIRMEHLFAHYENIKQMEAVNESEIDTLSKRVLKVV